MARPNLFSFATSELSQDAFIAWLLAWADPSHREADGPLHQAGLNLLGRLLDAAGVARPSVVRSVRIERQWKRIDVLAVVNDAIAILIENKTHTSNHSGQLGRYLGLARARFQEPDWKVAPIYLKTGDQCGYDDVLQAGWRCFLRGDFLSVLREGQGLGVRSDIFLDFARHLQAMEDAVQAFQGEPPASWGRCSPCWSGFFAALQRHLPDSWWRLVKPPRALPFMGFGWAWHAGTHQGQAVARFLHLEEGKLCFKLEARPKDRTLRKGAWRSWRDAVAAAAIPAGLAVEPGRFRSGTWMTVATLQGYRQADGRGLVDVGQTVGLLRQAEEVQRAALAALPLDPAAPPPGPGGAG